MNKKAKQNRNRLFLLIFGCMMFFIQAYAGLQYNGGYYFEDNGLPVYLHGAGSGFILLDLETDIQNHNTWYTSQGANANRIKGFRGNDTNGSAPWIWIQTLKEDQLKYDLFEFDPVYWNRLVEYARDMKSRHAYFIFQFFDGELLDESKWSYHPFNRENNINGIDVKGDPAREFYNLKNNDVLQAQKLYMEGVVKTLAPFGNTVFELSTNYSGGVEWQKIMSRFLHELGKKYGTPVLIINDLPEALNEVSLEDLDAIDIHKMAQDMNLEQFSSLVSRIWKYNKPIINSYAVLGDGESFKGKDWMERLILTLWIHRVNGVQFGGAGPKPKSLMQIKDFNLEAFGHFHQQVQTMAFWSMEPHNELTSHGWCIASPGHEYLTLVIEKVPEVTIDFSAVNQHLGYGMTNPITLKADFVNVRENTPVSEKHTYKNKVDGSMVVLNLDGIAKFPIKKAVNDIHVAWQANRKIYHKMKHRGEWCATEVISPQDALLCKHVQMDIDDDRNIYVCWGGPPQWKQGKDILSYRSWWRKFDGSAWSPVEFLNDGKWQGGNFPDLIVDHSGNIHYIYSEILDKEERTIKEGREYKAEARAVIITPDGVRSEPVPLYREGSKDLRYQVVVDSKNRVYAMNGWRYQCRVKVFAENKWGPDVNIPVEFPGQNFSGWHARIGKGDTIYLIASCGRKHPDLTETLDDRSQGNAFRTSPLLMWIIEPGKDPYKPKIAGPIDFGRGSFAKMCINTETGYPVAVYSRKGKLYYREWEEQFFGPEYWIPTSGIHVVAFGDLNYSRTSNAVAIDHEGNWHIVFTTVERLYYMRREKNTKKWSEPELLHTGRALHRIEIRAIPPASLADRRW